jgi:hypothetical protein
MTKKIKGLTQNFYFNFYRKILRTEEVVIHITDTQTLTNLTEIIDDKGKQ